MWATNSLQFHDLHQQIFRLYPLKIDYHHNFKNPNSWRRYNSGSIRCGAKRSKNYYELLGVSVEASPQDIKDAYRKLQKKYHPDIIGEKGHNSTLVLNKAYKILMRDELRKEYDESIGVGVGKGVFGSTWKGPLRAQALFVDENACIGCRQCVQEASNTFMMDEACGTARVQVQYGDDANKIEISVESCPVNCIHWVDADDLAVLEYLIRPQPKKGYGIYGQGWERPADVFTAAESFKKQEENQRDGKSRDEEETPAQAQARERAYRELKISSFDRFWGWMKKSTGQ